MRTSGDLVRRTAAVAFVIVPADALVYAVPGGPVCVIGYEWSHSTATYADGRLQDGRCLEP